MINPFEQINWKPDSVAVRSFGKTVCIGLTLIGVVLFVYNLWNMSSEKAFFLGLYPIVVGVAVGVLSYVVPTLAKPLYFLWYFLSACIGIIISNLLLILFYYVFFTPFALVLRSATGRDPLQLKRSAGAETYWKSVNGTKEPKRYFKQY